MFPTYGRYEGRHHEGNDDGLEHVEEELPDVLHIHRLPPAPGSITGFLESKAQTNS